VLYESYIELAEKLNSMVPISGPTKSIFLTTGAEATENAIKIARAATGRSGIIAFTGAFHGRTVLAMNMTGKTSPYKTGFGPALPDIWHVPFPVERLGVSAGDTLRQIEFLFRADVAPSRVAAIVIEPVQGEGGFYPAPRELMRALREICDRHGIVLIVDEVQTGFGRTGKMFAIENFDVEPDLICLGKSLAGGFPLSGVVGRAKIMDAVGPGGLGGTYAGSPISCVAALAVLDVFEREGLLERAMAIGDKLRDRIQAWSVRNDLVPISAPRGVGAMVAFDVVKDRSEMPDPAGTQIVVQKAYKSGLILLSCGIDANTIRILVPLTVTDDVLNDGLSRLEEALGSTDS
jgi:4-aminobutyrate aminotransferase/(S)-3-amino-2-methylpropionate transaminase